MARTKHDEDGCVFVTVGTTSFDALIAVVDSDPFAQMLVKKGYSTLVVQYGALAAVCWWTECFVRVLKLMQRPHTLLALRARGTPAKTCRLAVVAGRGEHEPRLAHARRYGVACTAYRFTDAPGIHAAMSEATLVISHAVRSLLCKCADLAHSTWTCDLFAGRLPCSCICTAVDKFSS
jgi:UDP-N-acetylglucosamine transferase subunit ALG13